MIFYKAQHTDTKTTLIVFPTAKMWLYLCVLYLQLQKHKFFLNSLTIINYTHLLTTTVII